MRGSTNDPAFACGGHPRALEAQMKMLLLSVTFAAMLASLAEAQQVSDARVADLVKAGKIRVGGHGVGNQLFRNTKTPVANASR
jgi:hypothetical protein